MYDNLICQFDQIDKKKVMNIETYGMKNQIKTCRHISRAFSIASLEDTSGQFIRDSNCDHIFLGKISSAASSPARACKLLHACRSCHSHMSDVNIAAGWEAT